MGGGALALALVLTGCGATQKEPAAGTTFNRTDVHFAQDMIPRQGQAATMSALAKTHASDPAVVVLAGRIHGAQGPWTRVMNGCLTRWDHDAPSEMMIRHHLATLSLAKSEIAHGTSPSARDLATKVERMQGPELSQMRRLMQR